MFIFDETAKMFGFTIGQPFLLSVTIYILVPSLMVFLSLVLPVSVTLMANTALAALYAFTIAGGSVVVASGLYVFYREQQVRRSSGGT